MKWSNRAVRVVEDGAGGGGTLGQAKRWETKQPHSLAVCSYIYCMYLSMTMCASELSSIDWPVPPVSVITSETMAMAMP